MFQLTRLYEKEMKRIENIIVETTGGGGGGRVIPLYNPQMKSSKKICDNALRKQDLKFFNGDSNYSDDLNVHLNYRLFCPLQWGYEYRNI